MPREQSGGPVSKHFGTATQETRQRITRSDEQERIVEAALSGGNIGVRAGAGTGKTKTTEELAWEMTERNWRWRGLYLAYNKNAAKLAIPRLPPTVEVRTYHSLAMSQHGRFLGALSRGPFELQAMVASCLGLGDGPIGRTNVMAVIDTVAGFCNSADRRVLPTHVPEVYADKIIDSEAVAAMAQTVFDEMNASSGKIAMTHDAYLKGWQLRSPMLDYDTIMSDEFQDANPPVLDVFLNQKAQLIAVGDSAQAIYGFRGAVDGFASMDATILNLRQSWRFGPGVATLANSILASKGDPFRLLGSPTVKSRLAVNDGAVPDVVLARTNFGLVDAALALKQRGATIGFMGEAEALAEKMLGAAALYAGHPSTLPELRNFRTWEELVAMSETEQGKNYAGLVRIVQTYGEETQEVARAIRAASAARDKCDVVLGTIHAFKGDEAAHVGLAGDLKEFCDFDDRAGGEFVFNHDEANVVYVAVTRAINVLDLGRAAAMIQSSLSTAMEMREAAAAAATASATARAV